MCPDIIEKTEKSTEKRVSTIAYVLNLKKTEGSNISGLPHSVSQYLQAHRS